MIGGVFDFLRKNRSQSRVTPARAPGETIRPADLAALKQWIATHRDVEGYVEPETIVQELSVLLVDAAGSTFRASLGGPKGLNVALAELGIPLYDVEETGYPPRMRAKLDRERILKAREAQARRRKEAQLDRQADDIATLNQMLELDYPDQPEREQR